jgi:N-acetylglucosaminyldiphosphoundecaprenol N-acetyl-beta-D-mannosaminyltransferase
VPLTDSATPRSATPRVDVLGVGISCVNLQNTVDIFEGWIEARASHYVCVTGMHGVMESQSDSALRDIHNRSGLTTPDGMPMVWAGRRCGAAISRVYGPDLMHAVLARANELGWSNYFVGGAPGAIECLLESLHAPYPDLVVVGHACPPFRPLSAEEDASLVAQINAAAPDVIWVGLGTPKQERWMSEHRAALHAPVLVGVGAAFDLVSGRLAQAPPWMQRNGLEWLYRMKVEPRRLWRRYLLNIPRFALALLRRPPRLWPESAASGP